MSKKLTYKNKGGKKVSSILYDTVCRFYRAISERPKDNFKFELLSLFPENCCEYSSLLLAKVITKQVRMAAIDVITGEDRANKEIRHAWLRINKINIDITANQFDSLLCPILFYKGTGWHKKFRIIKEHRFDPKFYLKYHDDIRLSILDDYRYLEAKTRKTVSR